MLYPIAIEQGPESFGVVVPDIVGCTSGGDTLDDAISSAREAIEAHLETLAADGVEPPVAATVQHWAQSGEYAGWIWAVVEIDTSKYSGKTACFKESS